MASPNDLDSSDEGFYADTPRGIFTAAGTWYHTSEALLEEYAGSLLDEVSVTDLLKKAEEWLSTPITLGVLSLAVALLLVPWWLAVLTSVVVYVLWSVVGPSFVSLTLVPVMRVLNTPWFQGLLYVFVLSILAAQDAMVALGAGFIGFVFFRWRLVTRALAPVVEQLQQKMYPLPPPDQVLRSVVIRSAMKHNTGLPEIEAMERDILRRLRKSD